MKLDDKLMKIFKKKFSLKISESKIRLLNTRKLKKWDSLGHLNLILEIEKQFNIKFSFDEIVESKSFNKILNLLIKKC